ncbi:MAG: hypothetical protein NC938_06285 [Candidatus Omnitrophica bacterium]|nr:hypothetical protein [Candidatus Omnitrophota bacterium]
MKRVIIAALAVAVAASAVYADNIFDVLSSAVKTTVSGVQKTFSNARPAKVISDTVEDAGQATQEAGEAAVGTAGNAVGLVKQAVSNK